MRTERARSGVGAVSAVLFLCLFAGQAAMIAIAPVLADVADDLGVSTAAAGQLRTITGLSAGVTALALGRLGARVGLGRQLALACGLLAVGSLASAVAPSFPLLALAQVPIGIGVATVTTAGLLAAAEWVPAEHRTRVLSWALVGQPAAWVVGMPLVGLVGERSWRYGWLALPLVAALAAGIAVAQRGGTPRVQSQPTRLRAVLAERAMVRWLSSELFANTAWSGTLVYSGALFLESYGASTSRTGIVLAVGAAAYVVGTLTARRLAHRAAGPLPIMLALALAAGDIIFGAVRPSLLVSTALFSAVAFVAGARTLIASAFGLAAPAELRTTAMGIRAATTQIGYFTGSLAAGAALAVGGYTAFGCVMSFLFLCAAAMLALPHAATGASLLRQRAAAVGWSPRREAAEGSR